MNLAQELVARSGNACELCGGTDTLQALPVSPKAGDTVAEVVNTCETCRTQIVDPGQVDINHWRCLNDSMWNTEPAVQVLAWRMLDRLKAEGWPQDLLDMMYLEEETLIWAKAGLPEESEETLIHKDSNGALLSAGDTVVLIKDLNVKGANFTAKRGTAVRNISLSHDDSTHIEGRVNGQHIVILTQYVKKS